MTNEELQIIKALSSTATLPDRRLSCDCSLGKFCDSCNEIRAYHRDRHNARYNLERQAVVLVPQLIALIDAQDKEIEQLSTDRYKEMRRAESVLARAEEKAK